MTNERNDECPLCGRISYSMVEVMDTGREYYICQLDEIYWPTRWQLEQDCA